jgi:hypothetical protein
MGPCVRRDDLLRLYEATTDQRTAQFSHMRFPCRKRGEVASSALIFPRECPPALAPNSGHSVNLDEILVRQWPARKLSELAANRE